MTFCPATKRSEFLETQLAKPLTGITRTKFLKVLSNRQSTVTFRPETDEIKLKSFKTNSAFSTGKLFLTTRHEEPERTPTPAIKLGRDVQYASLC